ncbi:probable apyrase 7 isoform X2 [Neltuma alba]|uniref:probable apyrase 7 isoform X2 n=1 Tax=Neltuma alba TaxID=207710 RepID=UPI0010A37B51|nr:probable apyrase 7 isoform X2 [Prosopis alba]
MEFPQSPSKVKKFTKNRWMLMIGTVIFLVMLLLLGFYLELDHRKANTVFKGSYYAVVVDCGSTGTRVNVHEWTVDSASTSNLPILLHSYPDNTTRSSLWNSSCQYHCMQTEPGLDKFVNDSSGVKESLEPLIIWAEKVVPRERHKDTPIFVLATAGLRRLASSDAEQVLEDVEAVVKDHSFMYKNSWIRVLSGIEEAYYGWVALNYKMGSFAGYPRSPTLGLLDLGGSSLQIVMEVGDTDDGIHTMRSKLNSIEHQIIAYSLPAFGLNEAFDRTVYMLTNNQSREKTGVSFEIRHPCLRSNFLQNYTCYSCSGYQKNHSKLPKDELSYLHLVGEPDWGRCKDLAIAAALNLSDLSAPHPTVAN